MNTRPPDADPVIHTAALAKRFGSRWAVRDLHLSVPRGSVFGFLGPNGSGKTTTIRMLLGLAAPTSGTVSVLGQPMPRAALSVLPRVGALVEGPAFYPYLSGRANLLRLDAADRTADPHSRGRRVDAALERVGLLRTARLPVHAYSLGMRQRLGIAHALTGQHELLVLDEPTNGLDPQGTREVRRLVGSLADAGTTVFVSSHLLSEVEQVCTHAAVMGHGQLLAQGTLAQLRGSAKRVVVHTADSGAAARVLDGLGLQVLTCAATTVRAAAGPRTPPAERIVAALVASGVGVRGFTLEGSSLEERFVELTGEGFDVD